MSMNRWNRRGKLRWWIAAAVCLTPQIGVVGKEIPTRDRSRSADLTTRTLDEYGKRFEEHRAHAKKFLAEMASLREFLEQVEEEAKVVGVLRYTRVTPSTATDTAVTEQQWLAIFGAVLYLFLGVVSLLKRTEAWASKDAEETSRSAGLHPSSPGAPADVPPPEGDALPPVGCHASSVVDRRTSVAAAVETIGGHGSGGATGTPDDGGIGKDVEETSRSAGLHPSSPGAPADVPPPEGDALPPVGCHASSVVDRRTSVAAAVETIGGHASGGATGTPDDGDIGKDAEETSRAAGLHPSSPGAPADVPPPEGDALPPVGCHASSVVDRRTSVAAAVETIGGHGSGGATGTPDDGGIGKASLEPSTLPTAQSWSSSLPAPASRPSAPAKVVGAPTLAPSVPSTVNSTTKSSYGVSGTRAQKASTVDVNTAAKTRWARRKAKRQAKLSANPARGRMAASLEGGAPSETTPPSQEADTEAGKPAGVSLSQGDAAPNNTSTVTSVTGSITSGASVEATDGSSLGGTSVGKVACGTGKSALPETPEAPASVSPLGMENPEGSNRCALTSVLQYTRHVRLLVRKAMEVADATKEPEKVLSEEGRMHLEQLSRSERRRLMSANRPRRTLMAILGTFFKAAEKRAQAGKTAEVQPNIKEFLTNTNGIRRRQQMDAPELLGEILEKVAEEVEADTTGNLQPLLEEIRGETSTTSTCDCGRIGDPVPAPFHILPLAMVSHEGVEKGNSPTSSVMDLLRKYFDKEEGLDACIVCEGGERNDNKKSSITTLTKAPGKLLLHLKRFEIDRVTYRAKKLDQLVEMPHVLNVGPFMPGDKGETLYELDSIIHHSVWKNDPDRGHYSTYVHLGGDTWRCYNDKNVTAVRMDDTIAAGALIISYTLRR